MAKKDIAESLGKLANAWNQLAPDALFSEMSREQFVEAVAPSVEARTEITDLTRKRKASYATRRNTDSTSTALYQRVINAIKGSPAHGEDSPLYRAIGYKTKSERRSGLTRKKSTGTPP